MATTPDTDSYKSLACSLQIADTEAATFHYEAISYAWGAIFKERQIFCDGKHIRITRSLYEALQRFRLEDRTRVLWADAICIDQENTEERSAQVRLMSQVYREAYSVLVWLGHAVELEVQKTFAAICKYNRVSARTNEICYTWLDRLVPATDDDAPEYDSEEECLPALVRLCSCAWFRRGWVAQEIALARTAHVHWSHGTIDFAHLGWAIYYFWSRHKSARIQLLHCWSLYRIYLAHTIPHDVSGIDFFALMSLMQESGFSDPRDRVYGLLGMRTADCEYEVGAILVEPNYNASILQCYQQLTEALVVQRNDLRLLSLIWHDTDMADGKNQTVDEAWPSWVPNFAVSAPDRLPIGLYLPPTQAPNSNVHAAWTERVGLHNCICMPGFRIDVVARRHGHAGAGLPGLDSSEQTQKLRSLLNYLEADLGAASIGCASIGLSGKFDGQTQEGGRADRIQHNRYRAIALWDPVEDETTVRPTADAAAGLTDDDIHTSTPRKSKRRIFETQAGMLGLGPGITKAGDVVVFLFGGSYPFVLREKSNGLWRLIGDVYMYDMSEGNVIERWEESGQEPGVFKIC